jgi:hypothetical protein
LLDPNLQSGRERTHSDLSVPPLESDSPPDFAIVLLVVRYKRNMLPARRSLPLLPFAALCLLLSCPASFAGTIVSNLAAGDTFNGTFGGLAVAGSDIVYQAVAQLFTSPGNFDVTQIDIGLVYQFGTNSAMVSLWTDSGGQPGTELGSWIPSNFPASGSLGGNMTSLSGGQIIAGITGVELLTGQSYFLAAVPGAADTALTWYLQNPSVPALNVYVQEVSPAGAWAQQATEPDGAYAVFGNTFVPASVPEPASTLLVLGGLAACILRRFIRYN